MGRAICSALLCLATGLFTAVKAAPIRTAGFDCEKATQVDERAICADGMLSKMDKELNQLFYSAVSRKGFDSFKIRQDQRIFLSRRRSCKDNAPCISALYNARIADLNAVLGLTEITIERVAQKKALVEQARKLLTLSLNCAAEPEQEGAALYFKYVNKYIGDTTIFRLNTTIYKFEGFRFQDGSKKIGDDIIVEGINAAVKSTMQMTYSAPLKTIDSIHVSQTGAIDIACVDASLCFNYSLSETVNACEGGAGEKCEYAAIAPESERRSGAYISGVCWTQVKNAGDALGILVSSAKFGQTD